MPGRSPLWLLAGLVVVLAIGGPGSMIGFDFARTFNPAHRIGTATGIVNVGGFIAALVAIFLIGFVLDVLHAQRLLPGRALGLEPFRIALSVQFVLLARRGRRHHRHPAESAPADGRAGRRGAAAAGGARRQRRLSAERRRSAERPAHAWHWVHAGCAHHSARAGTVIHIAQSGLPRAAAAKLVP